MLPSIVFFLSVHGENLSLETLKNFEGEKIREYGEKISHFNEKIRKVRRDFLKFSPAGNHKKNMMGSIEIHSSVEGINYDIVRILQKVVELSVNNTSFLSKSSDLPKLRSNPGD